MTKPTSEQVTFLAAGSGATQRTALDKLRDVVSVKDFGAVGDGVADDTAAIQAAVTYAALSSSSSVTFPPTSNAYKVTGSINLFSRMMLIGNNARINFSGSANLFQIPLVEKTTIKDLHIFGSNAANTYAINVVGVGGIGGNSVTIENCIIKDFGDVATGSGGGIYVGADTARLSIVRNLISCAGTGITIRAPVDGMNISDNHISGGNSRAIDIDLATGSATGMVFHNIMTNKNGAIKIAATASATLYVLLNEYEQTGTIVNASNAAYEFLASNIFADGNYGAIADKATYVFYVADAVFNGTFSNNRGSTDGTKTIFRVGSSTAFNRYVNNISYNTNGVLLYSDPAHPGITQWPSRTAPVTITTASYTVPTNDQAFVQQLIFNHAGSMVVTLPSASANTGRSLLLKTTQAQTVDSASSNVVPLAGGAAGTAILTATAGKYAELVSDGTNWVIMSAN
jgi:hypothetical protein